MTNDESTAALLQGDERLVKASAALFMLINLAVLHQQLNIFEDGNVG
jgi:hypothetical protein